MIVPETVKTIGGNAFYKCSALTSLQLPSEVEEIGDYAFYECSAWAIDVTLPGLKTLGKGLSKIGNQIAQPHRSSIGNNSGVCVRRMLQPCVDNAQRRLVDD